MEVVVALEAKLVPILEMGVRNEDWVKGAMVVVILTNELQQKGPLSAPFFHYKVGGINDVSLDWSLEPAPK